METNLFLFSTNFPDALYLDSHCVWCIPLSSVLIYVQCSSYSLFGKYRIFAGGGGEDFSAHVFPGRPFRSYHFFSTAGTEWFSFRPKIFAQNFCSLLSRFPGKHLFLIMGRKSFTYWAGREAIPALFKKIKKNWAGMTGPEQFRAGTSPTLYWTSFQLYAALSSDIIRNYTC